MHKISCRMNYRGIAAVLPLFSVREDATSIGTALDEREEFYEIKKVNWK